MKGQVFTINKIHYVNGIVYKVADNNGCSLIYLAEKYTETTPSGNVKHPIERVSSLARFAEGLGLITMNKERDLIAVTAIGQKYADLRSQNKWEITKKQKEVLGKFILSDYYRSETIYAITTLFELIKMEYSGTELSHKWAEEINKDRDWNSEVTYEGFTKFGINYITELGLLDIDEKDLLIVDISKEQKYQNDSNRVKSITLPPGELPRPKPKNYSGNIKYSTNPRRAKTALESSRFKCEFNENHNTFLNKASNEQYMEAHHLVPMNKQGLFSVDIDVPENILCICPTCHRKIHHAVDEDKLDLLSLALKDRNEALRSRGIEIDIEKLKDFYKID